MATDLLERIRKLLALAKSSNLNEAKAALDAANKIARENQIDIAMFEAQQGKATEDCVIDREPVFTFQKIVHWKKQLLKTLADHYGCSTYIDTLNHGPKTGVRYVWREIETDEVYKHGPRKGQKKTRRVQEPETTYEWVDYGWKLVGRQSDIDIVRYMWVWLSTALVRFCRIEAKGTKKSGATSWMFGAVHGIRHQLNEMKAKERQGASENKIQALVLLDNRTELAKTFMESKLTLRNVTSTGRISSDGMYGRGFVKGKNMHLGDSLPKGNGKLLPGKS